MGRPIENIIGKEFGDFEVIELTKDPNGKDTEHTFWKCRCKLCGEIRIYPKYYLAKRKEIKCKSITLGNDLSSLNNILRYHDWPELTYEEFKDINKNIIIKNKYIISNSKEKLQEKINIYKTLYK